MHSGGGPLPAPTYPLMMKRTAITSGDQELPQAKPSLMKTSTIIDALDQISKSPFTHKIEGARLPRQFHQPTFTVYNG